MTRQAYCGEGPYYSEDLGEYVVVEKPKFDPITSMLESEWTFYQRKGDELGFLGKAHFRIRIYTITEIVYIAEKAGWRLEALYGSLKGDLFIPGRTVRLYEKSIARLI